MKRNIAVITHQIPFSKMPYVWQAIEDFKGYMGACDLPVSIEPIGELEPLLRSQGVDLRTIPQPNDAGHVDKGSLDSFCTFDVKIAARKGLVNFSDILVVLGTVLI